jgi:hypothetical protein
MTTTQTAAELTMEERLERDLFEAERALANLRETKDSMPLWQYDRAFDAAMKRRMDVLLSLNSPARTTTRYQCPSCGHRGEQPSAELLVCFNCFKPSGPSEGKSK